MKIAKQRKIHWEDFLKLYLVRAVIAAIMVESERYVVVSGCIYRPENFQEWLIIVSERDIYPTSLTPILIYP